MILSNGYAAHSYYFGKKQDDQAEHDMNIQMERRTLQSLIHLQEKYMNMHFTKPLRVLRMKETIHMSKMEMH